MRSRPGCASATTRRRAPAPREFRDIFGAGNFFLELMDHGLDIETPGPRRTCSGCGRDLRPAADRHQRPALHARRRRRDARGAAVRAVRQDHGRPQPVQVRRPRLLPQVAGRDALALGRQVRPARGLRQHAADRRAVRGRLHRGRRTTCRASRCPEGEDENSWFVKEVERGLLHRYPGGVPAEVRKQADYEVGVIIQMGFPGYFLVVADFINWAKEQRHPGRPGPWLGRRLDRRLRDAHHRPRPAAARPDLRAVPQPRPRLDARHRHRLRRAPPRRRDPLRHREVRRRPGRPDHHLRHDQGQGRRSRTPPGCSATRSRWATGSPR